MGYGRLVIKVRICSLKQAFTGGVAMAIHTRTVGNVLARMKRAYLQLSNAANDLPRTVTVKQQAKVAENAAVLSGNVDSLVADYAAAIAALPAR